MPTKPNQMTLDAHKKKLEPKEVLLTVINETPELREAAISAGVVKEV